VKTRHWIWIRRLSQAFFLILFLFLLVETRLPQDVYQNYSLALSAGDEVALDQPVGFFFQLDPLVWFSSLISGHRWIEGAFWAVLVLLVTLFLGRVFCGFVCPFGTVHHLTGAIRPALKGRRRFTANERRPSQKVKYFILISGLLAAMLGLNWLGLLDPIAFFFRGAALAVVPAVGDALREVFHSMAQSDVKILNLLSYGAEVLVAPVFGYEAKAYQTAWLIGILFLVVLFLNRIRPRFWCRTLCPLGALLGLCSRFAVLRLVKFPERCTDCQRCQQECQGAASPVPGDAWESSECLLCLNCFGNCPEDALSFRLAFRWPPKANRPPDMGRRALLGGLLAGVSLPFLGRLDGQIHKTADPRLIRPPGSVSEEDFLTLCQRCGLCMKVCPTNVINPALAEAGMAGFWTPRLIMTQGYCEYTCTLCSGVCPTGAIRKISAQEKIQKPIKIGSAYVDRGRCLPWSGNAPCIVCEEHCPTSPKAIYLKEAVVAAPDGKSLKVQLPYVDLRRCVGCGICENKCPVRGRAAIRTIAAGESRSLKNQILLGGSPY
jgi:polyferredoxin/ferredoxin